MSLVYENRGFADYPAGVDEPSSHDHSHSHSLHQQHQGYPSSNPATGNGLDYTASQLESALGLQIPELPRKMDEEMGMGGGMVMARPKGFIKPEREVTKTEDGLYMCTWPGCVEEIRSFNRKCEWTKHMDKHDRPYKCPEEGCDKLPGFTYSGGLSRHQREVHNLNGGPRKQLNCPHINCKRHVGKGFSRQENLNEHLRRVHTADSSAANEETEDEGMERPVKRKRVSEEVGGEPPVDFRESYNRLAQENQDLRRQVEIQGAQIAELIQRLGEAQHDMLGSPRLQNGAPQALM